MVPTRRESARRNVVRLVFVVYLLAIFEGVLRKWLLPQYSQPLFFIRDPFVLAAYLLAILHHLWPRSSPALTIGLIAAITGALIALLQLGLHGIEATQTLLAIYGWRNYFYYLPLAFLVAATFERQDVERLMRLTLLLALPVAFLVAVQFRSPADAPINVGNAVNGVAQFKGLGLDEDHTRPMGTFTSPTGQTMFLGSAFAMLLGLVVTPRRRRSIGTVTLAVGLVGTLTGVALSGSRYTILHCALALAAAMFVGAVTRQATVRWRALVLPAGLAVVTMLLYPILFPAGFSALATRWSHAADVEGGAFGGGLIERALSGMTDFLPLLHNVPALGYGLGFGGNASTTLGATIDGMTALQLAESDWARHIVDLGPIFGLLIIGLRIGLVLWLLRMVLRYTRAAGDPLAMLLFSFAGVELLYGQITGHGSVNVYGWLFLGLCLASMKRQPQHAVFPRHPRQICNEVDEIRPREISLRQK